MGKLSFQLNFMYENMLNNCHDLGGNCESGKPCRCEDCLKEHQCKDPKCSPELVHFHGSSYTSSATEEGILEGLARYRAKRKIAWVWFGVVVVFLIIIGILVDYFV